MSLKELAQLGLVQLFEKAEAVLDERGLAKGLRFNPTEGSVDLVASLAIAAGAKPKDLIASTTLLDTGLPDNKELLLHAAMDVLDALRNEPDAWADRPDVTVIEVQSLLREAAMLLRVAVI